MAEAFVEGGVFVVFAFDDAVFDAEGVEGIFAEGVAGDFGGPTGEVFAVEKGDPLGGVEREEEQRENTKNHRRTLPIAADFGELLGGGSTRGVTAGDFFHLNLRGGFASRYRPFVNG